MARTTNRVLSGPPGPIAAQSPRARLEPFRQQPDAGALRTAHVSILPALEQV